MKALCLLILISVLNTAKADELELTWLGFQGMDWLQTLHIAKHPNEFYETNLILGLHPSVMEVNLYFLATSIGVISINRLLPKKYNKVWMGFNITNTSKYVADNRSVGIEIKMNIGW